MPTFLRSLITESQPLIKFQKCCGFLFGILERLASLRNSMPKIFRIPSPKTTLFLTTVFRIAEWERSGIALPPNLARFSSDWSTFTRVDVLHNSTQRRRSKTVILVMLSPFFTSLRRYSSFLLGWWFVVDCTQHFHTCRHLFYFK